MMNPVTKAHKELLNIENELNLFDKEFQGVPYWEYTRHSLKEEVVESVSSSSINKESFDDDQIRHILERFIQAGGIIKNTFNGNPYLAPEVRAIFYGKRRREQLENGEWKDIFLDPIAEYIDVSSVFFEPHDTIPEYHGDTVSENIFYLTIPRNIGAILRRIGYDVNLDEKNIAVLTALEEQIKKRLGVSVDAVGHVEEILSRRKSTLFLYDKIIQRVSPQICFLTSGYDKHAIFLESCRRNNVLTVGVQYTALTPQKWGYHYPGERKKQIKPDYYFIWGEFWKKNVDLPLPVDRIRVVGNPWYNKKRAQTVNTSSDNILLFISNKKSKEISKVANAVSKMDLGFQIMYKLHPNEIQDWENTYPELSTADNSNRLTVVTKDYDLYELFAMAAAQVGISSTALYEGLGFDLPTFLYDGEYIDEMSRLIEYGYADVFSDPSDLVTMMSNSLDNTKVDHTQFFDPNYRENVQRELQKIGRVTKSNRVHTNYHKL